MTDVFIHVPSTAGTTMWTLLDKGYGGGTRRIMSPDREEDERKVREVLHSKNPPPLVGGHVHRSALWELPESSRCITLLRDPVSRVISHWFRKIRKGKRPSAGDPVNPDCNDLIPFSEEFGLQGLELLLNKSLQQLNEINQSFSGADVEELCRKVHSRFWFVGFVEEFDRSLVALGLSLKWKSIPHYDKRNKGGNKLQIPGPILASIARQTSLESAVVEKLKNENLRKWRNKIPHFEWQYRKYHLVGNVRRLAASWFVPGYSTRFLRK